MLLGNTGNLRKQADSKENIQLIILLISQKRYAEAYELLDSSAENITNLYNKALCCYATEQPDIAVSLLDKCLSRLSQPLRENRLPEDIIIQNIRTFQFLTNDHLKAITEEYVRNFQEQTFDNLLRMKVDCYFKLNKWSEVIATASKLIRKNKYDNVIRALTVAQQNIK